jgi:hypothetical protein
VLHLIPVNQPAGYNPPGIRNLQPDWIAKLGHIGRESFATIVN